MTPPILKILRVIAFWIFLAMCYYFCHSLANNHYRNRFDSSHEDDDDEEVNRDHRNENQYSTNTSNDESREVRKAFLSSTLISKKIVSPKKGSSGSGANIPAKEIEKKSTIPTKCTSSTSDQESTVGVEMETEEQATKRKQKDGEGAMSQNCSLQPSSSSSSSSSFPKCLAQPIQLKNISNKTCFICLCEYEDGDTICSSPNSQCVHIFHQDCIMEWLMRHDECPCCRNDYLDINTAMCTTATSPSSTPIPSAPMEDGNNHRDPRDVEMGITIFTEAQSDPPVPTINRQEEHHVTVDSTLNISPV